MNIQFPDASAYSADLQRRKIMAAKFKAKPVSPTITPTPPKTSEALNQHVQLAIGVLRALGRREFGTLTLREIVEAQIGTQPPEFNLDLTAALAALGIQCIQKHPRKYVIPKQ